MYQIEDVTEIQPNPSKPTYRTTHCTCTVRFLKLLIHGSDSLFGRVLGRRSRNVRLEFESSEIRNYQLESLQLGHYKFSFAR